MRRVFPFLTILALALPAFAAAEVNDPYGHIDRTKHFPFKSGATMQGQN